MPKDMPKEMLKEIKESLSEGMSSEDISYALYKYLMMERPLEQDVKFYADYIRKNVPTRVFYKAMEATYSRLMQEGSKPSVRYSEYLLLLYGHHLKNNLICCDSGNAPRQMKSVEKVTEPKQSERDRMDEIVNFESVVKYALKDCDKYEEVKTIYDMLLEMMGGIKDSKWIEAKKALKSRMKRLSAGVTIEHADEFVAEKNVGYEVGYVEKGGTGVKIKE